MTTDVVTNDNWYSNLDITCKLYLTPSFLHDLQESVSLV